MKGANAKRLQQIHTHKVHIENLHFDVLKFGLWTMSLYCWDKWRLQGEKILERNQEVFFQRDNYSRKPYIPHSLVVHLS